MTKVLLVDDDKKVQTNLPQLFRDEFFFIPCLNGENAIKLLDTERPEIVLLDINLPDTDGITLLTEMTGKTMAPPVIMLTGFSDTKLVVESIMKGAVDYIVKPFSRDQLKAAILGARRRNPAAEQGGRSEVPDPLSRITGDSREIEEVRRLIAVFANSDIPVFLSGESGTGKDLVARTIHLMSPRCGGPFIVRNCGAIPETLIETEIFGCEKGAFTDAVTKPGSFELAHCGTLFLDEIGEMSLSSQVKLLRILEDREVLRVGGRRSIGYDVRIITASNRDLGVAVEEGSFRQDLYYRIKILPIHIPPLRHRKEDIPLLIERFLQGSGKRINSAALRKLVDHNWPGNIRELKNTLSRAVLLAGDCELGPETISFV